DYERREDCFIDCCLRNDNNGHALSSHSFLPLRCPRPGDSGRRGEPATLVVDIDTVGQDPETIPSRAREILLDVATEEDRQKIIESLALDPCTGRIICIGVHWLELDRSRAYCQPDERELLANFWSDMGQIRPQRFVTFNGKSFDFPYINIRSAIMGVPIPRDILLDTRRFSTERHFDVREILTNFERYR